MSNAHLYANVNLDAMEIENVRIMSDSNPTCYGARQTWLRIATSSGETFSEALRDMEQRLAPGGDLHCRWYNHLDSVKALREHEAGIAERAEERKSAEIQAFWFDSYDATGSLA